MTHEIGPHPNSTRKHIPGQIITSKAKKKNHINATYATYRVMLKYKSDQNSSTIQVSSQKLRLA